MSDFQSQYSKMINHIDIYYFTKQQDESNKANFYENTENGNKLFMDRSSITNIIDNIWFIESGFTNRRTFLSSLFRALDEPQESDVWLCDE